jgi:hypothetical protein
MHVDVAVSPVEQARAAGREEAFRAVLDVAARQTGEDATARAGLIGCAVAEAREALR